MVDKIVKSDDEWQQELTREQYHVTRRKGTERPFTGAYHATKEPGIYACVCCGQALFDAATKYDSRSGWPSFYDPIARDAISTETDRSHAMERVEVLCSRCNAHLGHVFPDGPDPTGQRYCMNSASLKLMPEKQEEES